MSNSMVFTQRMPAGVAGGLSRPDEATVETQAMDTNAPATAFGQAVRIVDGKVAAPIAATTADDIYGLVVRVWPNISGQLGTSFTDGAPNPTEPVPVLVRGYMSVVCGAGTPAKGGAVYVRVASPTAGKPLGGLEAAEDGANTIVLTNAIFTGPMDSNNITEIRLWR